MRFIDNFDLLALINTLISVATAFVLGSIIAHLTAKPYLSQAFWNPVTSE